MTQDNSFLAKCRATSDASNALYYLLQDLNIRDPEVREPSDMMDTQYGKLVIDAFLAHRTDFQRNDVVPTIPTGFPSTYPIISDIDAAQLIRNTLIALRSDVVNDRFEIDTSAGMEGFSRSVDAYFAVQFGAVPATDFVAGAMTMLPHTIDWNNRRDAGTFGEYLKLRRSFVTFHTQQQIYVQQLNAAIQRLDVDSLDEGLVTELRYVQTRVEKSVADLQGYFFEHGTLSKLHTENLQNSLFRENRKYRAYAGRLVLNVSQANDLDHSGDFGSLLLVAVNNWFKKQGGVVKSAVQSAEKTSFQFTLEDRGDLKRLFSDRFSQEIQQELRLEYDRRYKEPASVDGKARELLSCINAFTARGDASVLPLDTTNLLDLVIQDASDVEAFGELLLLAMPRRIKGEIKTMLAMEGTDREDAARVLFAKIKPFVEGRPVDMRMMKDWVKDTSHGVGESERRKNVLQAFVLQGVYYHLKYLSGVLDYFEKERASVGAVGVYFESDLPTESDVREYAKLQTYLARDKYVSDGAYDPGVEKYQLFDEALMAHLPHLSALQEQGGVEGSAQLHPKIARILRIWERSQRLWGQLDHERRGSEGGAKQLLYRAVELVSEAIVDDDGDKTAALTELKGTSQKFADAMRHMWAKSIADPKNPYFLKGEVTGTTSNGTIINVNVFKQELARLGWTGVMGVEADSMQAYLRAHSLEFSPDFNDAAFLSAWDIILEVAWEWRMPYPLIYRPAGDFVMVVIPPKDVNDVPVDIEAFTYEVWRRVASKYEDKPFHDVKKVTMTQSIVSFDESYDAVSLNLALTQIADQLNLQTVPFMLPEKDNTYILYRAEGNEWGEDDITTRVIIDELMERGISIKEFELDVQGAFERLEIYFKDEGSERKYRYAKFNPGGDWQEFMKTLTFTTVAGKSGRVINHVTSKVFTKMQDEMADDAEAAKDELAPYKMGFAIHESAKITEGNLEGRLSEHWGRLSKLAEHVEISLGEIEDRLSTLFGSRQSISVYGDATRLSLQANSEFSWVSILRMSMGRIDADNISLGMGLDRSGLKFTEGFHRRHGELSDVRNEARDILEQMIKAFSVITGHAAKGVDSFSESDVETTMLATGHLMSKIGEFRALKMKPGSASGSTSGGEGGGPVSGEGSDVSGLGGAADQTGTPEGPGVDASAFHDELWFGNAFDSGGEVVTDFDRYGVGDTAGDVEASYQNVSSASHLYPLPMDPMTTSWVGAHTSLQSGVHFLGQAYSGLPAISIAPMQTMHLASMGNGVFGAVRAVY
ncbi:MAG: hypothetical protein HN337_03200 [Deltaproteobacteria bacterium]|nr:hypothetical protein [Deltaproteobacteria bacterium]